MPKMYKESFPYPPSGVQPQNTSELNPPNGGPASIPGGVNSIYLSDNTKVAGGNSNIYLKDAQKIPGGANDIYSGEVTKISGGANDISLPDNQATSQTGIYLKDNTPV